MKVDGLAGDVHVTTQAGAVEGRAFTSDQVTVKTEAGAASLEFAAAPSLIRTTTSAGAVELASRHYRLRSGRPDLGRR